MEEALGLELSVLSKAIPEDFVNLSQIIELKLRDSLINIHLNSDPNILDRLGLISSSISVINTATNKLTNKHFHRNSPPHQFERIRLESQFPEADS